jgi:hypothetical protein
LGATARENKTLLNKATPQRSLSSCHENSFNFQPHTSCHGSNFDQPHPHHEIVIEMEHIVRMVLTFQETIINKIDRITKSDIQHMCRMLPRQLMPTPNLSSDYQTLPQRQYHSDWNRIFQVHIICLHIPQWINIMLPLSQSLLQMSPIRIPLPPKTLHGRFLA